MRKLSTGTKWALGLGAAAAVTAVVVLIAKSASGSQQQGGQPSQGSTFQAGHTYMALVTNAQNFTPTEGMIQAGLNTLAPGAFKVRGVSPGPNGVAIAFDCLKDTDVPGGAAAFNFGLAGVGVTMKDMGLTADWSGTMMAV